MKPGCIHFNTAGLHLTGTEHRRNGPCGHSKPGICFTFSTAMDSLTGLSLPPVSSGNEPRPQMIARGEGRTHNFSTFTGVLLNGPVLFLKWWSRWGTAPHKDGLKIHRSLIFHPSWHWAKDNKYLTTPTDNLKNQQLPKRRQLKHTHAIPQTVHHHGAPQETLHPHFPFS